MIINGIIANVVLSEQIGYLVYPPEAGNPALFWSFSSPQTIISATSVEIIIQPYSGQLLHGEQASFRSLLDILTLSVQDISILGNIAEITISEQSGYLISNTILNGIPQDIGITGIQGHLEGASVVDGNTAELIITEQLGYLISSNILVGTTVSIDITEQTGELIQGTTVLANIENISLSGQQGHLVTGEIQASIPTFTLGRLGSYDTSGITINGNIAAVQLSEQTGQVIYNPILNGIIENITLQGQQGSVFTGLEQAGFHSTITWMSWGLAAYGQAIINGSIASITITEFSGSYGSDILISSTPDNILLTGQLGTVIQGTTINSSIENIAIQGTQGQLSNQVLIDSTIDTIIVQGEVGELNYSYTIEGIPGSVSLTTWQGSVEYGYDTNIDGNISILTITPLTGSVIGTIVINGVPDDIEVLGSNSEVYIENIFSGSIESITIQEQQGLVIVQYILTGNVPNIIIQEPQGYLIASNILLGNTDNISTQGTTGLVILGDTILGNIGNIVITEQLGTLTISTIIDGSEDNLAIEGVTGIYYIPDTLPSPEPLRIILQRQESLKIII